MTLFSGTRLGPYEIQAAIGAGGMGEVYKARDTRLNRTVAIKVLPATIASDPEFRERFDREARAISSLDHPHICTLYDVGEAPAVASGGAELAGPTVHFLVMQYLEGESLADRLKKGPLPFEQVLKCAMEIADALDKAHRQGIVHRDLKPGNIMLTKSGAKLLDFGLAKAAGGPHTSGSGQQPAQPLSAAATLTTPLTAQGAILGTFQYMAPEQLEGGEADARSDIWAFGCVLYEMATGRKAFGGRSQVSLIGAILKDEPAPITTLAPAAPPALDRIVGACLAKDPADRLQSAHDLLLELQWSRDQSMTGARSAVAVPRRRVAWLPWSMALLSLVSLAALLVRNWLHSAPVPPSMRFALPLPEGIVPRFMALSPDARSLAFIAAGPDGRNAIWVRTIDAAEPRLLAGTEGTGYSFPFWSPDARFVGFFAQGKLKRIAVQGGATQVIADAPAGRGGTWNRDGVIVFAPRPESELYRVDAGGGTPVPVTRLERKGKTPQRSHRLPNFLPDGRHFLYSAWGSGTERAIELASLDGGDPSEIVTDVNTQAYVSQECLLYVRQETLMAQPFDLRARRATGEALPIVDHVADDDFGSRAFAVSHEGGLLVFRGGTVPTTELLWFDRAGKRLATAGAPGAYANAALSPDGRKIAVGVVDQQSGAEDVWVLDLDRQLRTRLTFDPIGEFLPVWSPDGSRIAFASERTGFASQSLYDKPASGGDTERPLIVGHENNEPLDWSPDGQYLLYRVQEGPQSIWNFWMLPLTGDRKPRAYLQSSFPKLRGRFSPDGKWVAYVSLESGRREVYVQAFPTPDAKWQISTSGGDFPQWRADGKELVYSTLDWNVTAAPVNATSSSFKVGAPQVLFEATGAVDLDMTADGQRFLVTMAVKTQPSPVIVLLNWAQAVAR